MDSNLAITLTGGSISLAAIVIAIVKWSLSRNVEHEDSVKVETKAELENHDKRLQEVRDTYTRELQDVRSEMMMSSHKAELSAHDARTQLASLAGSFGELKGALLSLRESFEEGREKQAIFYRAELAKTENLFRQELTRSTLEMSRSVHPELPERLSRLELAVANLAPKPKR